MSVNTVQTLPRGNSAERAEAKETIWRLSAIAFAHPIEPFQDALASGDFHSAFDGAWSAVTGRHWPPPKAPENFETFETGYIGTFHHSRRGKPIASLMGGDHESLLNGHLRPVFMLNVTAFYRHFGLKAAVGDEGRTDEPDHLVCMLEFMSVLAHLEANAIRAGKQPDAYLRAQRDFLSRYLKPLLKSINTQLRATKKVPLDETLRQLLSDLEGFAETQISELEIRVGPFRDHENQTQSGGSGEPRGVKQNLWG